MKNMNKAVFFDKDGVLNKDKGLSFKIEEIELFNGVYETIKDLKNKGYKIFIVTNQAVVARGFITEEGLKQYLKEFEKIVCKGEKGLIDKIYYCPHHPNADVMMYRINCECRKPKSGMLLKAAGEFDVDLSKSYMIGDRVSDITAGFLAGCKTILLRTGKHNNEMIETDLKLEKDIVCDYAIDAIDEVKGIIK